MSRIPFAIYIFAPLAVVAACSSNGDTTSNADAGPVGGPVATSQPDDHCGTTIQLVDPAACNAQPADAGAHAEDGGAPVADDSDAGGGATSEFGATMNGSEGDDDDCKYHVSWTSTPVRENVNVTFTMKLTNLATNAPSGGAKPYVEVVLDDNHPAPVTGDSTEPTPGTYVIGPVVFDKAGRWTVRFHVNGDCTDTLETSPHGHAAFYVDVP